MKAALLFLLAAAPLAGQAPTVRPGASLDLAALAGGELRAAVAPVVIKRAAFGISVARWSGGAAETVYPVELALTVPVGTGTVNHPLHEYLFDLYARVYSAPTAGSRRRVAGYLGAVVGYHRRERMQDAIVCPVGVMIPCPLLESAGGASIPCQSPCSPIGIQSIRTVRSGVEPGADFGVRLTPWNNLFVDVGGRTRLITFEDPTARFTEGHLASRLTLAVGVDW